MSYVEPFSNIVTLTKRNHRYYGQTESNKFRGSLTEIATDLGTIFGAANDFNTSVDAIASGYLQPGTETNLEQSLYDLKRYVYHLEDKLSHRIYIQAKQITILE